MSLSVLIVDDSKSMRELIIDSLQKSGLELTEIHEADNGEDGLVILKNHNVDFALVDLNMPLMDGDDMVNNIRRNPDTNKLPVVFISSEKNPERIQHLLTKGAGFIRKPFDPQSLGEIVFNLIGG